MLFREENMSGEVPVSAMPALQEWLKGPWTFERKITSINSLAGVAYFLEYEDGLLYSEKLRFPSPSGKVLLAHREYFYRFSEGNLAIYFAYEGKPADIFMELSLSGLRGKMLARGSHLCLNDFYSGEFEFSGESDFSIIYTVKGPKKDYVISTVYSKALEK
jgi:hypothetical protein